jgi:MscS family membrane protein
MKRIHSRIWRAGLAIAISSFLLMLVGGEPPANTNAPPGASNVAKAAAVPKQAGNAILTFGLDRIEVLKEVKLLEEPLWKYIASLIYILLALFSSKLIDWLVSSRLRAWVAKTKGELDDVLLQVAHGPIKAISFVIFLHIGLRMFNWTPWLQEYLSKGLKIVVAWSLTYMALKLVDVLVAYWRKRAATAEDKAFDDQIVGILRKSMKGFIIVVAALATSQNLGIDITSIIASLSIGGLALGLAAQDTIANLFGALSIFVDRPFRIGDRIKLDSVDGFVESIGLRSTRVRNLDGHLITIPNKTMAGATITNISRRPNIKTEMTFGVVYETPPAKLRRAVEILQEVYGKHPMTADLLVSFKEFGDSALNIYVAHWWAATDYRTYLDGMQELNLAVMERFAAEGITIAFPSQTLYLRQDSEWKLKAMSAAE